MWSYPAILLLVVILFAGMAWGVDAQTQPQPFGRARALVTYGPRPEYPHAARAAGITGSGVAVMDVDRATGKVTSAVMAISTGSPILDDATLYALRQWRFKPGTVNKVKAPINYTMGGSPAFEYHVKQKPMEEVLAHFLGKGVVLNGPIPAYPRFPPWTDRHGEGVYELHVRRDGSVSEVKIMQRSGDDRFDRVTIATLRKWRLRRGPLVVELPLSFTLTPWSYSVDIPKNH